MEIYGRYIKSFLKGSAAAMAAILLVFAVACYGPAARKGTVSGGSPPLRTEPLPQKADFNIYRTGGGLSYLYLAETVEIETDGFFEKLREAVENAYNIRTHKIYNDEGLLIVDLFKQEAERLGSESTEAKSVLAQLCKSLIEIDGIYGIKLLFAGEETAVSGQLPGAQPICLGTDGVVLPERVFLAYPVSKKLRGNAPRLSDAIFEAANDGRVVTCGISAGEGGIETIRGRLDDSERSGEIFSEKGGYEEYGHLMLSFGYNMRGRVFEIACSDDALSAITPDSLKDRAGLLRREENNRDGTHTMVFETDGGFLVYFIFLRGDAMSALVSYSVLCPDAAADMIRYTDVQIRQS